MSLKLHRACKVIGFTQKQIKDGWPQAFNLEQIAKLQFPENSSDESVFCRALRADCAVGSLKHIATIERREYELSASLRSDYKELIRHAARDNSYEVTVHYVDHRDLVAWLEKQGEEPSAHLASWIEATTPETPAQPVVDESASDGVDTDKAGPLPVETRAMADSFAGLRWNGKEWLKKLGNKTVWLDACLVLNRSRGEGMRQWNPVLIGAYLVRMDHAKAKSVRARFQTQPSLIPWLDTWKTYEADNWPTD